METSVGIGDMQDLLAGTGSVTPFDNTHARVGVGDGNGSVPSVQASDTTLTAGTNKLFKAVDASYPQRSGTTLTYRATFQANEANFAWNEWGLDNANNGGPGHLFNHVGTSLGTKSSGAIWILTVTVTQS